MMFQYLMMSQEGVLVWLAGCVTTFNGFVEFGVVSYLSHIL